MSSKQNFLPRPPPFFYLIACYFFPHALPCLKMLDFFLHLLSIISFFLSLIVFCHYLNSLSLHSTIRFSFRLSDPHSPLFSPPFYFLSFHCVPLPMDLGTTSHLPSASSHQCTCTHTPPTHPPTHTHTRLIHIPPVSVSLELPEGIKSTFKFIFLFLFPL